MTGEYNQPVRYDFIDHYKGNGLLPFVLRLKYKNGDPLDLTGARVAMQLKRAYYSNAEFEFNSDGSGDALFTIIDPLDGKIQFPSIGEWNIPTAIYDYDLQIIYPTIFPNGFSRTYLFGKWAVNQDITSLK